MTKIVIKLTMIVLIVISAIPIVLLSGVYPLKGKFGNYFVKKKSIGDAFILSGVVSAVPVGIIGIFTHPMILIINFVMVGVGLLWWVLKIGS